MHVNPVRNCVGERDGVGGGLEMGTSYKLFLLNFSIRFVGKGFGSLTFKSLFYYFLMSFCIPLAKKGKNKNLSLFSNGHFSSSDNDVH